MQKSTLLLTATFASAILYTKWSNKPHSRENGGRTPRSRAREASLQSMLTRYNAQVDENISALQTCVSHHSQKTQELHDELNRTFHENEQRRMHDFRTARVSHQRIFDDAVAERHPSLIATAEHRWDTTFAADMQEWMQDMRSFSRAQKQAFKEERQSWRKWGILFREAQQRARQELEELNWRYLVAHMDRARKLEFAHHNMGQDAPDNGFPRHIIIDDATMYAPIQYGTDSEAFQVVIEDGDDRDDNEDSDDNDDDNDNEDDEDDTASEHDETETVQTELEDARSEHGNVQGGTESGVEAGRQEAKADEGEQTTAAEAHRLGAQRHEGAVQIEGETSGHPGTEDEDEKQSFERLFVAHVDAADQRWADATKHIQESISQSSHHLTTLFDTHTRISSFNTSLRHRLHHIDTIRRAAHLRHFEDDLSRCRQRYQHDFTAFLADARASHTASQESHAREFTLSVVDPVERMLRYWRDAFAAVRTKQRMHSQNFLELYEQILHGRPVEHATYDWETARRLAETYPARTARSDAEERASSRSSSMDSRALEPSEPSLPPPPPSALSEIADSLAVNFTDSEPDINSPTTPDPDESLSELQERESSGAGTPSYTANVPTHERAESLPHAHPASPEAFTSGCTAGSLPPSPTLLTTLLTKARRALTLLAHLFTPSPDPQTRSFHHRLRARSRRHARASAHLQRKFAESSEAARHAARRSAGELEASREAEFRRAEAERQRAFAKAVRMRERGEARVVARQERGFSMEHAGRRRCAAAHVRVMERASEKSRGARKEMCAQLLVGMRRLVEEEVEMFEEEEQRRGVRVGEMVGLTGSLLRPLGGRIRGGSLISQPALITADKQPSTLTILKHYIHGNYQKTKVDAMSASTRACEDGY
ncbi:hypothetical protein C0992_003082 [Termitomyces sp. T32_za158]|nr:hypothetical protein C0992_003082 [Termitomyces sp. T32_za158]